MSGLLFKFIKHNGWLYYCEAGKTIRAPTVYLPLRAENFRNGTVLKNQVNGEELDDWTHYLCAIITHYEGGLFVERDFLSGAPFFGNAATLRIKPLKHNMPNLITILCHLNGGDDQLIIALENAQIVVFFHNKNRHKDSYAEKLETQLFLPEQSWLSLGFNFKGDSGYGLSSVYLWGNEFKLDMAPMTNLTSINLFGAHYRIGPILDPSFSFLPYAGGVSDLKIYPHALTAREFESALEGFNDAENGGEILCDFVFSGALLDFGIEVS